MDDVGEVRRMAMLLRMPPVMIRETLMEKGASSRRRVLV